MNNEDKNNKLEELERRQREIADEIEQLRKEPEEPVPWEPKGGGYEVRDEISFSPNRLAVTKLEPKGNRRLVGSQYPTREASVSVAKRDYFFRRLCALACELNPSGVLGSKYGLVWDAKWDMAEAASSKFVDCVFETASAAQKAADILNRDGWRLD